MMRARGWLPILSVVAVALCAAGVSACGDDDSGDAAAEKPKIAFMNQSAANTYVSETWDEIKRVAAERGAEVTQFDAAFDAAKQQQQLQTAIASGKYQGIILNAISDALSADATAAAEAGITVGTVGPILGKAMDTSDPQVEGVSFGVHDPPANWGQRMGKLAIQACEGKDPCRVVYFYGIKGSPSDEGFFDAFEETISGNEAIDIVATPEGKYLGPDVALAAMQNVLQSNPDVDVVVGADQSMQGVELALDQAGKLDQVAIIGLGGSDVGIERIAAGKWFGGVMTAPATEGEIAMETMLDILEKGGSDAPQGLNPLSRVPHDGVITRETVDEFTPQWKG